MSSFRWIGYMAAGLAIALLAAQGAAADTAQAARKAEVVRAATANHAGLSDPAVLIAAAENAEALTDLTLDKAGEGNCARVRVTGDPGCEVFSMEGGSKIVVDLLNVVNLHSGEVLEAANGGPVAAVRTSLYALEPQFVSRIVLDLSACMRHRVERNENHMRVLVRQGDQEVCVLDVASEKSEAPVENPEPQANELAEALTELRNVAPSSVKENERDLSAALEDLRAAQPAVVKERPSGLAKDLELVAAARPNLVLPGLGLSGAVDEQAVPEGTDAPAPEAAPADSSAAEPAEAPEAAESSEAVEPAETPAEGNEPAAEPAPGAEEAAEAAPEAPLPPPVRDTAPDTTEANAELTVIKQRVEQETIAAPMPLGGTPSAPAVEAPKPKWQGNPLDMPVNLDFREMEMANVVALLASMADINVIAGTELTGTVTLSLKDVPLRQAIQTVLRINGLGMIEEEGIYRIVPYEQSVAAKRTTMLVNLEQASTDEVRKVLDEILVGTLDQDLVSISANPKTNVLVISGPEARVAELVGLAHQLDVGEPVLPTVTEAIKLNYAEPVGVLETVKGVLTPKTGQVTADSRARHLIVTDMPAVVEQVRALVQQLDMPVRQVAIDAMVVDATLNDDAETGVDWMLSAVRRQSRRDAALGSDRVVSNLQELGMGTALGLGDTAAGALTFGILSNDIDLRGLIQAEVRNQNGHLLSNPVVVTVENKPATITIAQEIPYVELTQTDAGGSQTNTEFKEVGTKLEVTPRVTHDENVILDVSAKESGTAGEFNDVPIEDKREVKTSLRMKNGQTVFIGGLRKNDNDTTITKVPILGDIPGLNLVFRNNSRTERVNELLIFVTCNVLPEEMPDPTAYQKQKYKQGQDMPMRPDAQGELLYDAFHPGEMRDPIWKVRRTQ